MRSWQEQYIANTKEIAALCDPCRLPSDSFAAWYEAQVQALDRISILRKENMALLGGCLFPLLDALHGAAAEELSALEEFSDALMDWRTNLDCGVYILIHDALLSLYRVRCDRGGIIRELYKLGMGLYYRNRVTDGIEDPAILRYMFQNEMVFTEAGSYLRFFEEIPDEETKGYIIRALANISICTSDRRKRIAVTARILRIIRDSYYRELAPGLPWDTFLRRTNQQMSANRTTLSRGNLSKEELSSILESCYEIFTPEVNNPDPNIRWLWPYYEMEYSCGFADLNTTLQRLQSLIRRLPFDQYDESGLYGNVQLPIYYGRLMKDNPALIEDPKHVAFLSEAYDKMMRTLMTFPIESFTEYFHYIIRIVFTAYLEIPGVPGYRDITTRLMQRFSGPLYVRSRRIGMLLRTLCGAIIRQEPGFFDDIPFLCESDSAESKRAMLLDYAEGCGLYHDFGRIKMDMERTRQTRELLEDEFHLFQLHTVSGRDDLSARQSTAVFADVAHGHHAWYNGAGGDSDSYLRNESPYRQMTDVVAVAVFLADGFLEDPDGIFDRIQAQAHRRFSPMVCAFLGSSELRAELTSLLRGSDAPYYREVYRQLTGRND